MTNDKDDASAHLNKGADGGLRSAEPQAPMLMRQGSIGAKNATIFARHGEAAFVRRRRNRKTILGKTYASSDKLFHGRSFSYVAHSRPRLGTTRPSRHLVTLVPVAAILVASIRLHFLDVPLSLQYDGPHVLACDAAYRKGEEMGWFEHGSTIIVFAPESFALCKNVQEGSIIRAGQPLMLLP